MKPWQNETFAANGKTVRENFDAWFDRSQVVAATGEPLVVYHGTWYEFDRFEQSEDIGFHFGSEETANKRISLWLDGDETGGDGANVMPVYLSIQKPLRLRDLHTWDSDDVAGALRDAGLLTKEQAWDFAEYNDRDMVRDLLAKHGYDGIVYANETEGGGDSYIVFDASQVKSALGNAGLYLKDSLSMTDVEATLTLTRASSAREAITETKTPGAKP